MTDLVQRLRNIVSPPKQTGMSALDLIRTVEEAADRIQNLQEYITELEEDRNILNMKRQKLEAALRKIAEAKPSWAPEDPDRWNAGDVFRLIVIARLALEGK